MGAVQPYHQPRYYQAGWRENGKRRRQAGGGAEIDSLVAIMGRKSYSTKVWPNRPGGWFSFCGSSEPFCGKCSGKS